MASHVCAKCKAEKKRDHLASHLTPAQEAYGRKQRRLFADLEAEFEAERRAERAALARGERPRPGQVKMDAVNGVTPVEISPSPTYEEQALATIEANMVAIAAL